jgi:diguanylate cyclase
VEEEKVNFSEERKKLLRCLEAFLKALKDGEIPYPEVYRTYYLQASGNEEEIVSLLSETRNLLEEVAGLGLPISLKAKEQLEKLEYLQKQIDFLNEEFLKDDLTELWNRRALTYYFDKEVRKKAVECFYCLAFIDLNDFKSINDTFGHLEGDRFLRLFADFLKQKFSRDFLSRYGGDEFVLISVSPLQEVKKQLADCMESAPVFRGRKITFACGLTPVVAKDDLYSALSRADTGMYQSKETGKVEVVRV